MSQSKVMMKIYFFLLFPNAHLARIVQRGLIPFCVLPALMFYLLCLKMGILPYFGWVLWKGGFILGGRALSLFFIKLGCSGGLSLMLVFAVGVIANGNMMLPSGDSGTQPSSASSPVPSISSRGDSWIEETYGDACEAESSSAPHQGPQPQGGEAANPAPANNAPAIGEANQAAFRELLKTHEAIEEYEYFMDMDIDMDNGTQPAPSGPSSSSKDFEMRLEPSSETGASVNSSIPRAAPLDEVPQDEIWGFLESEVERNLSQETSLRQRLNAFGNEESPFLMGKTRFEFYAEVQESLRSAKTQTEYSSILDFENRDLRIREHKKVCFSLLREALFRRPYLLPRCRDSSVDEAVLSFLEEIREELEGGLTDPDINSHYLDEMEINRFIKIAKDLKEKGDLSYYFQQFEKDFFEE